MKRFKAKKVKKKNGKFIIIIFTFFFFFSYIFVIKYLSSNKLSKDILNENIDYIGFDMVHMLSNKINKSINKPVNLLNNNIKNIKEEKVMMTTSKKVIQVSKSTEDNKYTPEIYIYNTHQSEKYTDFAVYDAAKYLSNSLDDLGIDTYFEENSVQAFLQENNLKYYKSYTASKKYLNNAKEKYSGLNYFFDIHRDSVKKDKSTLSKDGKTYAKILFVIGKDNISYARNLNNAIKLNEIIESIIPGISRGILQKQGKGVDGVYNQDISENLFLIEVGGTDNTKEEVLNTIDILADAISIYVRGKV